MPVFYFDIIDGTAIPDDEGTEMRDLDEARVQAVKLAGACIVDHAEQFWSGGEWRINVSGQNRLVLFSLIFFAVEGAGSGGGASARLST